MNAPNAFSISCWGRSGSASRSLAGFALVPLIRFRSPGAPAIYRQTRIGQHGKPFTLYKFRTMDADAEARRADVLPLNEVDGPVFKMDHDPRGVDRLRWLRKYSLDELPQFWNVVKGDMSIVGPRPPLPEEVAQYTDYQRQRLAVKPGLTCTWQVEGRSEIPFDEWVELDLEYIRTRSTLGDLKLIARTIPAVISARGAR